MTFLTFLIKILTFLTSIIINLEAVAYVVICEAMIT